MNGRGDDSCDERDFRAYLGRCDTCESGPSNDRGEPGKSSLVLLRASENVKERVVRSGRRLRGTSGDSIRIVGADGPVLGDTSRPPGMDEAR